MLLHRNLLHEIGDWAYGFLKQVLQTVTNLSLTLHRRVHILGPSREQILNVFAVAYQQRLNEWWASRTRRRLGSPRGAQLSSCTPVHTALLHGPRLEFNAFLY